MLKAGLKQVRDKMCMRPHATTSVINTFAGTTAKSLHYIAESYVEQIFIMPGLDDPYRLKE
eukprot:347187-Chlamydomonas_euryale.AAC.1